MIWDTGPPMWDLCIFHFVTNVYCFCYALSLISHSHIYPCLVGYQTDDRVGALTETGVTLPQVLILGVLAVRTGAFFLLF